MPEHAIIDIQVWMFNVATLINKSCIRLTGMIEPFQWTPRLNMFIYVNLHGVHMRIMQDRSPEVSKEWAWQNIIHGLAGQESLTNFNNIYPIWVHPESKITISRYQLKSDNRKDCLVAKVLVKEVADRTKPRGLERLEENVHLLPFLLQMIKLFIRLAQAK